MIFICAFHKLKLDCRKPERKFTMLNQLIETLNSGIISPGGDICRLGQHLTFIRLQDRKAANENGVATLTVESGALRISAAFRDTDIGNSARRNNIQTWLTGDAMECFLQVPGHDDYFEFHVTPENYTLQLHLPSAEGRASLPFEQKLCNAGIRTNARIEHDRNLWCGEIVVPFAGIGLADELTDGLAFAICRYNYNKPDPEPEISSTVRFAGETFHAPLQWHRLRIG